MDSMSRTPAAAPVGCVIVVPVLPRWITDFGALSTALAGLGWKVRIFHSSPNDLRSGWDSRDTINEARAALPPGVETCEMPIRLHIRGFAPAAMLRAEWQAARTARACRKDYFIIWSALPTALWGPWLRLFGCDALYLITGLGRNFGHFRRGTLRHRLTCLLYRFVLGGRRSRIIVHNTEDKQELVTSAGVSPERIFVTGGCGVDPDEFSFDQTPVEFTARPTILVPSRLLRDKGIIEAAHASRILSERGVRHRMVFTSHPVVGRDDALTPEELDEARSAPDVEFVGYQKDMKVCFREAEIVCLPSWYREGLQTAILEAAALGKPLVVCDNVGVRDFFRGDTSGVIVEPRAPAALAGGLQAMLADAGRAEAMRRNAHARLLSGFTKQHMVEITLAVIDDSIGQR
jgi:glycosyltransferase involved in cell wall biosynthesis